MSKSELTPKQHEQLTEYQRAFVSRKERADSIATNPANAEAYELIYKLNPMVELSHDLFIPSTGERLGASVLHYLGLIEREGIDAAKRNDEVLRLVEILRPHTVSVPEMWQNMSYEARLAWEKENL